MDFNLATTDGQVSIVWATAVIACVLALVIVFLIR